jgi:hypothetical protein
MPVLFGMYQLIVGLITTLIVATVLRSRSVAQQATGAIVLVVLFLRLFLVK